MQGDTLKHVDATHAALLLWSAAAAGAAELKIGFIDAERINRESSRRAGEQANGEDFAPRAELQRREAQIKTLQGQLRKSP